MNQELTVVEELQQIYSDMFKDLHGFRPRSLTPETESELRYELACLQRDLEEQIEADRITEIEQIAKIEARINEVIEIGAGDRLTAIRWITETENFCSIQDVEMYVWSLGILHSDYGRKLNEEIQEVTTYVDYESLEAA